MTLNHQVDLYAVVVTRFAKCWLFDELRIERLDNRTEVCHSKHNSHDRLMSSGRQGFLG